MGAGHRAGVRRHLPPAWLNPIPDPYPYPPSTQAFGATFPQPDAERAAALLGPELLEALAAARRDGDAGGLEAVAALLRIYEVRLRRLSPLISSILPLSPPFSHYLLISPSIPSYLPLSPPISSHLLRIHQARLGGLLPKLRAALRCSRHSFRTWQ